MEAMEADLVAERVGMGNQDNVGFPGSPCQEGQVLCRLLSVSKHYCRPAASDRDNQVLYNRFAPLHFPHIVQQ